MRRGVVLIGAFAACIGRATAHGGTADGHVPWLPPLGFLVGVAVVAASLYADTRTAVADRHVDRGVGLGALTAFVSMASYALPV